MLGRLTNLGFEQVERIGVQRGKTVVRAYHPVHGWMYEKIDETDEAQSDAAIDRWAESANEPIVKDLRIGAVEEA